ncbi:MAG: LysR family transcriptional regulator [Clostridia bacterium]|nr:LysR family transcriptional regulator [Clostridia bacterium]
MDTRALQTFVTVCETRSYQKAAEILQYAPSSIFKHVQQLEQELGIRLFVHENRMLHLTKDGEAFLPHAQAILAEYRASFEKELPKVTSLTVGGCEMNTSNSLIDLFTSFARHHSSIHLNMITSPNSAVPDMVRNGQVDIGFYYGHSHQHRELQTISMYRETAFLIASRSNPLTLQEHLHYEDLNGMEFVYPHDSCCFVHMLMPELESRGIQLNKTTYLGGMQYVVNEARKPHVLTLAPEHALKHFRDMYDLVPLDMDEAPMYAWENILIGKRADLPEVRALVDYACTWAQHNPPANESDNASIIL